MGYTRRAASLSRRKDDIMTCPATRKEVEMITESEIRQRTTTIGHHLEADSKNRHRWTSSPNRKGSTTQQSTCCCKGASVVSDSVQSHRRQPTRLLHPWDSPDKNTGVGCHCLLQCMKVKSKSEVAQSCLTLHDTMDCSPPGSSVHGIFPGKRTGVGCHHLQST